MLTSKFNRVAILLLIFVVSVTSHPAGDIESVNNAIYGCEVPISSKAFVGTQWPLIFRMNGSLYETVDIDGSNSVVVSHGDEVIVSCGPNYIKSLGKSEQVQAKCGPSGQFRLHAQFEDATIKDLKCDLRPIEETKQQVYGCPTLLTSTRFGYVHPVRKHTYIIGESCYDETVGKTYFAHVKLGGTTQYLQKTDKSFLLHNNPDSTYKINFFKALRFDQIYERVRKTLKIKEAPGLKLSNYVDEPLLMQNQLRAVKKLSWNYFIMRDNLYTLDLLKEDIKDFSTTMELDIYIGSHGVNALSNSIGEQMDIYVDEDKQYPMPELIWILVKNADKAVAFGVFNNPDSQAEDVTRKSICKSECESIPWLTRVSNVKYRGPLICCRYDDFIQVVKEVPEWTGITGLLM